MSVMAKKQNGTATEGMSRSEAIRRAFEKLGADAMPGAVQKFVRDEWGTAVSSNLVSNIKGKLTRPSAAKAVPAAAPTKKKRRGRKKQAKPQVQVAAATTNGQGPALGAISLGDIEMVKNLAHRNGAASLHALIDLLTR